MYPVVNAGRVVQSFNDGWYYAACDDNRLQEVQRHEEGWQQVHLPHTWNADAYSTRNYRRASSWYLMVSILWQMCTSTASCSLPTKEVTLPLP